MGEIERRGIPEPYKPPKGERRDPTEWRPRDNRDWERVPANVDALRVTSTMHFASLADMTDRIAAIEMTALADLRATMNQSGLHPDERTLRVRWELVPEGYGYPVPEGFIHPEAPEDVQREGQAAWKRCVEMASDSLSKVIMVMAWRKRRRVAPAPSRMEITARSDD